MISYSLTSQEKWLIMLLRWWVGIFLAAAVVFAIAPDRVILVTNTFGRAVFGWKGAPLEPSLERFWLVLAISLMSVIIYAAIKAQADIIKNIEFVHIIIVAKLVSTISFAVAFFFSSDSFPYLAGAVVDGFIGALTYFAYRRAVVSRYVS